MSDLHSAELMDDDHSLFGENFLEEDMTDTKDAGDLPPCRKCGGAMKSGIVLVEGLSAGAKDFPGQAPEYTGQTLNPSRGWFPGCVSMMRLSQSSRHA